MLISRLRINEIAMNLYYPLSYSMTKSDLTKKALVPQLSSKTLIYYFKQVFKKNIVAIF